MKLQIFALISAVAVTTLAAPSPNDANVINALDARADNCFHKSDCGMGWSGKCESWCDEKKFSHMTRDGCGWNPLSQACCCVYR
jgi:hypothetical protein